MGSYLPGTVRSGSGSGLFTRASRADHALCSGAWRQTTSDGRGAIRVACGSAEVLHPPLSETTGDFLGRTWCGCATAGKIFYDPVIGLGTRHDRHFEHLRLDGLKPFGYNIRSIK